MKTSKRRDAWLRQFLFAFANDEAEESTSFQGTIPQALMMMNGELMQQAVSGKPGSFLGQLLTEAQRQSRVSRGLYGGFPLPGGSEPASDQPRRWAKLVNTSRRFRTASRFSRICSGLCSIPTSLF